ncbi:RagB/SusD family nutrient uptake outer membrane protein [Puteibacter caeruleilacunae]|nr:RagB/SusD family nutrient uptake outer membrane protein [Puteibacter caeruleilacunae]
MKKIKYISLSLAIACILMGLVSCEDRLLEEPTSQYAAETFFESTAQANMAVLGIYDVLGESNAYGRNLSVALMMDTDIQHASGTNLNNDKRMVAHYEANPVAGNLESTWLNLWKGIERANVVIQEIPQMDLFEHGSEEEQNTLKAYLGEAKFLRGMLYFDLVRVWGAVPVKLMPTDANDDMMLERASLKEVYDQIDIDMSEAGDLVPWQSEKGVEEERISKGGVLGIHARVCLNRGGYYLDVDGQKKRVENYKEYYQKAIELTQRVMDSGEHGLENNYEQIFRNYCENKVSTWETLFEVGLFNPEGGSGNTGIIGTFNGPSVHADSPYGRANSQVKTSPVFYAKFSSEDLRKDVAVARYKVLADGSKKELTSDKDEWGWAPGKWRRDWHTAAPKNVNNTDINWVIIRYSDVLLMHAEAQNEINEGPNADAYNAINQVRSRAGVEDLEEGLSKLEFFEILKDERALELSFEGLRKLDLYRWGILGETLRAHEAACLKWYKKAPVVMGKYFDDNKDELMPIPQREIDENANMIQNFGY